MRKPRPFRLALLASLVASPLAWAGDDRHYAVPAGPLSQALAEFAAQAGVTLPLDPAMLGDLRSPGLQGDAGTAEGFEQLLRGTPLEAVPQAGNTYTLRQRPSTSALHLDSTNINGLHDVRHSAIGPLYGYKASNSSVGTKTDAALRDIPQSIQVVPRQVLEDQQATSMADALSNVSSIQRGNTHGGSVESFIVRGFQGTTYAIDGVLTNSLTVRPEILTDLAGVERIEVLKGPASVLYGRGNPGGLINVVTRRPSLVPQAQVKLQSGSYDQQRGQAWISGPLSSEHGLAGSLAMAYQHEGTFRDHYRDSHRRYFAPSLSWSLNDVTRLDMGLEYTETNAQYDRGLQVIGKRVDSRYRVFLEEP